MSDGYIDDLIERLEVSARTVEISQEAKACIRYLLSRNKVISDALTQEARDRLGRGHIDRARRLQFLLNEAVVANGEDSSDG